MPLSIAPVNVGLKVMKVRGDSNVVKHLAALGIAEGSNISLYSSQRGAVIAVVLGSRLALDRNISNKIEVEIA